MFFQQRFLAEIPAHVFFFDPLHRLYRDSFKRSLDILLVLMALPIVLPLVLVLALVVVINGGSPFYSQERVGRDGHRYRMWKLRSMVVDADDRLQDHFDTNPEARAEWDETQKLRHDPRITRFGRFLRKSSLDELPQLWNVLIGHMSLVGPRPMLPEQQAMYPGSSYYGLRPGLTGLWQVSERNQSTFASRARYDDDYERSISLRTDALVIWRTVGVVMGATGL
ncbi:sugar transferase [Paracoccus sp. YIM 132242]|uniref:Sugar transferase n=1 Tax=Paracoccus lichenicola TaxID=2665644 RepID=A0A6L6HPD9_9RHOB|nr:sugar transferase [Paracoccus lichenicola]MTE01017.1 sugar transferase [Paracoccus lichenicola]